MEFSVRSANKMSTDTASCHIRLCKRERT